MFLYNYVIQGTISKYYIYSVRPILRAEHAPDTKNIRWAECFCDISMFLVSEACLAL